MLNNEVAGEWRASVAQHIALRTGRCFFRALSPAISTRKCSPEHRQTALRLGLGCFVLQNVPMFGELAVGHADDIGSDPILRPASIREPAVDDHVIAFGNDRARLVLQR